MRDTKGAEGDLHMAAAYLKERADTIRTDVPRRTNLLEKATEYVALAKRKDPDAAIFADGHTTVDDMAKKIHVEHYWDNRHYADETTINKRELLKAKEHIEIAFKLGLSTAAYGSTYCDTLLDLHDKQGAVAFARKMCADNPDLSTDIGRSCRKNLDRILVAPQTREVTAFEKFWDLNSGIIMFWGFIAAMIGVVVLAWNLQDFSILWLVPILLVAMVIISKFHGDAYISEQIGNQLKEDVTRYQRTGKW